MAMTYESVVQAARKKFLDTDVSSVQGTLAFQINLIGKVEGIFYIEIKDGRVNAATTPIMPIVTRISAKVNADLYRPDSTNLYDGVNTDKQKYFIIKSSLFIIFYIYILLYISK